jgi:hypothetical protein
LLAVELALGLGLVGSLYFLERVERTQEDLEGLDGFDIPRHVTPEIHFDQFRGRWM